MARTSVNLASPTIAEALAEFLAEQESRLAPRTFRGYRDVVDLLQHNLNDYAYQTLDEAEAALFDRLYKAKGAEHREYCDIFGPEKILREIGSFLGYFMVRKVFAGRELLRTAATVTKKLASWLARKGYTTAEEAGVAEERASEAARELPAARDLLEHLQAFTEEQRPRGQVRDEVEGYLRIARIEGNALWLEDSLGPRSVGPVALPAALCRRCQPGWVIAGVVGRVGNRWHLLEAWNVYAG